jgi:hypothetical protein
MEVCGLRTSRTVTLPLVVADHEGSRYLVSMLDEDSNRVRNVRAENGQAVLRHGRRETVHLQEVDPARRAPVLCRYLALALEGCARARGLAGPVSEFERIASRYPVFRIIVDRTGA